MLDLRGLNRRQFDRAKRLWAIALVTKLAAFGIGAIAVATSGSSIYMPMSLVVLSILADVVQLWSDSKRSDAERVLRLLDARDSLGRALSAADRRELAMDGRQSVEASEAVDSYFTSEEAVGPNRSIENLLESAWYSRHQASWMAWIYGVASTIVIGVSIAILVGALVDVTDQTARERLARVVLSCLMLLVSASMIRGVWSYGRLSVRCRRTEQACEFLLRAEVAPDDALRQWQEYQVARATAGMLPEWLWKLGGAKLEKAWDSARS